MLLSVVGHFRSSLVHLLPDTAYYLVETEAPQHYKKADTVWTVKLQTDKGGASLPHTGGPGTYIVYLSGIMLTGIAGAVLLLRRRRNSTAK